MDAVIGFYDPMLTPLFIGTSRTYNCSAPWLTLAGVNTQNRTVSGIAMLRQLAEYEGRGAQVLRALGPRIALHIRFETDPSSQAAAALFLRHST